MRYSTDIVVIDLEATCPAEDEGRNSVERSNIIEIGAVRLDRRSLEITAEFSELVRPEDHPIVPFITEITGISPDMVAGKDTFANMLAEELRKHDEWVVVDAFAASLKASAADVSSSGWDSSYGRSRRR